jgi:hypothetical protein
VTQQLQTANASRRSAVTSSASSPTRPF